MASTFRINVENFEVEKGGHGIILGKTPELS